jgi:DNA modification methylase
MKNSPTRKPSASISLGTIFALGDHRLAYGDSRDAKLVDKLFGRDRASLVLSDPPYGVAYVESKSGFKQKLGKEKIIANDHAQSEEEYQNFTKDWLEPIKHHLTPKNTYYIFNSDKMIFAMREGILNAGFKFTQLLIWAKSHAVIGRMDYLPQHELIAYGWYGTHKFMKSKDKTILIYPKPSSSKMHPTVKPTGLLRRLIMNSSSTHDIVYDGFGGSGSTLIACEDTKRRCFMIEIDPEYIATIIKRFEDKTGIKAKLIENAYEKTTTK